MTRLRSLLAALLAVAPVARAESPGFQSRDRYTGDYAVLGAGAATALGLLLVERYAVDLDSPLTHWGDDGKSYESDTFPGASLSLWAAPALVMGLVDGLDPTSPDDANQVFESTTGYAEALLLTVVLTEVAKLAVRRARPDYDDRIASGGDRADGALSFFSGHSSISFAAATYFVYWLGGRFVWGDEAAAHGWAVRGTVIALQAALFGLAGTIAGSRVVDHRHHWDDVLVGAVVGAGFASLSYWRRFDADGGLRSDEGGGPGTGAPTAWIGRLSGSF